MDHDAAGPDPLVHDPHLRRRDRRRLERAQRARIVAPRRDAPSVPAWPEGLRPARLEEIVRYASSLCGTCRGAGVTTPGRGRVRPCRCARRGFVSGGGTEWVRT